MLLRSIHTSLALCLISLLEACAPQLLEAVTNTHQKSDFSKVQKIAIQPINRANLSSILISDIQVARINDEITDELNRKGFDVVQDNAQADMYLVWHLVTQEKTDVRSYNSASYYNCWSCGSSSNISVRQYTQGTFIVDMIDPIRNQSVWRSTIQSRLKSQADPQAAVERRQEAVRAVFASFPPP